MIPCAPAIETTQFPCNSLKEIDNVCPLMNTMVKNSDYSVNENWSEKVEELVDKGELDNAISLLESVISNLETLDSDSNSANLRLAAAISDLAELESSRGFSDKADELRSKAYIMKSRGVDGSSLVERRGLESWEMLEDEEAGNLNDFNGNQEEEDDWEAIADSPIIGDALVSSQKESETTSLVPQQAVPVPKGTPKRRGRGSFLYNKSCLYSDQTDVDTSSGTCSRSEDDVDDNEIKVPNLRLGTGHVLVLYDFSPTTRTVDLEKLYDKFQDRGVAIRWVNDTIALAVFRTPVIAHEALNSVRCPFKVRKLDEEDEILRQNSKIDLDPPTSRPKTSARTAQRLIAQGMGIKLATNFGAKELRVQENERKNRIIARQTMKDDAWGAD